MYDSNEEREQSWSMAGTMATPIRLVVGWLFFSAFLRRLIMRPDKLDPSSAAYIGEQFNHFLPHALLIQPMLKFLVMHSQLLHIFLLTFTFIEGAVGVALLLGAGTRLAALGVSLMSWGILMGAGWLGTTCLDEWQIGALGIAVGVTLMLTGAGRWSVDQWLGKRLRKRWPRFFSWLASGRLPLTDGREHLPRICALASVLAVLWTVYTYQAFFNGVWGSLHNPSVQPHIVISNVRWDDAGGLTMTMFRDGGPDTYGAFVVAVSIKDATSHEVVHFDAKTLASLDQSQIENQYLVRARPNRSGLLMPLGSLAVVRLKPPARTMPLTEGNYQISVADVSGITWTAPLAYSHSMRISTNE